MGIISQVTFMGDCAPALEYYKGVFNGLKITSETFLDNKERFGGLVQSHCEGLVYRALLEFPGGGALIIGDSPSLLFKAEEEWGSGTSDNIILEYTSEDDVSLRQIYNKLLKGGMSNLPLEEREGYKLYGSVIDRYRLCWNLIVRGEKS